MELPAWATHKQVRRNPRFGVVVGEPQLLEEVSPFLVHEVAQDGSAAGHLFPRGEAPRWASMVQPDEQRRTNELLRENNKLLSNLISAVQSSGGFGGGGGGGGNRIGGLRGRGGGRGAGGLKGLRGAAGGLAGGLVGGLAAGAAAELARLGKAGALGGFDAAITGGSSAAIGGGFAQGVFTASTEIPLAGRVLKNTRFQDLNNAIDSVAAENSQLARQGFSQTDDQIRADLELTQAELTKGRQASNRVRNIGREVFGEQALETAGAAAPKAADLAIQFGQLSNEIRLLTPALRSLRLGMGAG